MSNDLQYTIAKVALYLVAAADRLRYLGVDMEKLVAVKTEHDELGEKVWLLEDAKCNFEERYAILAREKSAIEYQVTSLDREVVCFSQRVQDLVLEKDALEVSMRKKSKQLVIKASMERAFEEDLAWIL